MVMNHLNQDIEALIAEDRFIADVQIAINTLMEERGITRADLARAINVSEARVSQMFRESPNNFTIKTVARIFYALGETPEVTCEGLRALRMRAPVSDYEPAAQLAPAERRRKRWQFPSLKEDRHSNISPGFVNDNTEEDLELVA